MLKQYIRAILQEWSEDLKQVMFDKDDIKQKDLENPASEEEQQRGKNVFNANKTLNTTSTLAHKTNLGSGNSAARHPGGKNQ